MNKSIFIQSESLMLLFLLFGFIASVYSVDIGGRISKNTTLTNSNYTVTSDIVIDEKVKLIISSGAIFNFKGKFSIRCFGDLVISGRSYSRVQFNLISSETNNGTLVNNFNFITFESTSNKRNESSIDYLVISINATSSSNTKFIDGACFVFNSIYNPPRIQNSLLNSSSSSQNNIAFSYTALNKPQKSLDFSLINLKIIGFNSCISFGDTKNYAYGLLNLTGSFFQNCSINIKIANLELSLAQTSLEFFPSQSQANLFNIANAKSVSIENSQFYLSQSASNSSTLLNYDEWQIVSNNISIRNSSLNNVLLYLNGLADSNQKQMQILSSRFKISDLNNLRTQKYALNFGQYYQTSTQMNILVHFNNFIISSSRSATASFLSLFSFVSVLFSSYYKYYIYQKLDIQISSNLVEYSSKELFDLPNLIQLDQLNDSYVANQNYVKPNAKILNNTFKMPNGRFLPTPSSPYLITSIISLLVNFNFFLANFDQTRTKCPFLFGPNEYKLLYLNASFNYFGKNSQAFIQYCYSGFESSPYDYYPLIIRANEANLKLGQLIWRSKSSVINSTFYSSYLKSNITIRKPTNSSSCVYKVYDNVIVPANVTLTIEQGCVFLFEANTGIRVEGQLIVVSYARDKPIVFRALNTADRWLGISLAYPGRISTKFLTIQNTKTAITVDRTNLTLNEVIITDSISGLKLSTSPYSGYGNKVTISNSFIGIVSNDEFVFDSSYYDLSFNNVTLYNGKVSITSFKVISILKSNFSLWTTLYMESYFELCQTQPTSSIRISNSYLKLSSIYLSIYFFCMDLSEVSIANNTIVCESTDSNDSSCLKEIYLETYYKIKNTSPFDLLIASNQFVGMSSYVYVSTSVTRVLLQSNIFTNFTNTNVNRQSYLFKVKNDQDVVVFGNQVLNCSYESAFIINWVDSYRKVFIKNNKFKDSWPLLESKTYTTSVDLKNDCIYEISYNEFSRNTRIDFDLSVGFLSKNLIKAQYNYWNGLNETSRIKARINDPKNNIGNQMILLSPFLLVESKTTSLIYKFNCSSGCSGHGVCVGEETCRCNSGYKGQTCAEFACENYCNYNGDCVGPNNCTCSEGYYGSDCSKIDCPFDCNGNGQCYEPGVCECDYLYSGDYCENFQCEENCYNRGQCVSAYKCSCDSGYTGNLCETPVCLGDCSRRGSCIAPNKCNCYSSYSGDDCSLFKCENNCFGNGECVGPNICSCKQNYYGKYCDQLLLPTTKNILGN